MDVGLNNKIISGCLPIDSIFPIMSNDNTVTFGQQSWLKSGFTVGGSENIGTFAFNSDITHGLGDINGMTVHAGKIYACQNAEVKVFNESDLAFVENITLTGLGSSQAFATDGLNFWATTSTGVIQRFDFSTKAEISNVAIGAAGIGDSWGLCFDGTNFWVLELSNSVAHQITPSGTITGVSVTLNSGQSSPNGFTYAPDVDQFIVSDNSLPVAKVYSKEGTYVKDLSIVNSSKASAYGADRYYIGIGNLFKVYDISGTVGANFLYPDAFKTSGAAGMSVSKTDANTGAPLYVRVK